MAIGRKSLILDYNFAASQAFPQVFGSIIGRRCGVRITRRRRQGDARQPDNPSALEHQAAPVQDRADLPGLDLISLA